MYPPTTGASAYDQVIRLNFTRPRSVPYDNAVFVGVYARILSL